MHLLPPSPALLPALALPPCGRLSFEQTEMTLDEDDGGQIPASANTTHSPNTSIQTTHVTPDAGPRTQPATELGVFPDSTQDPGPSRRIDDLPRGGMRRLPRSARHRKNPLLQQVHDIGTFEAQPGE